MVFRWPANSTCTLEAQSESESSRGVTPLLVCCRAEGPSIGAPPPPHPIHKQFFMFPQPSWLTRVVDSMLRECLFLPRSAKHQWSTRKENLAHRRRGEKKLQRKNCNIHCWRLRTMDDPRPPHPFVDGKRASTWTGCVMSVGVSPTTWRSDGEVQSDAGLGDSTSKR